MVDERARQGNSKEFLKRKFQVIRTKNRASEVKDGDQNGENKTVKDREENKTMEKYVARTEPCKEPCR